MFIPLDLIRRARLALGNLSSVSERLVTNAWLAGVTIPAMYFTIHIGLECMGTHKERNAYVTTLEQSWDMPMAILD